MQAVIAEPVARRRPHIGVTTSWRESADDSTNEKVSDVIYGHVVENISNGRWVFGSKIVEAKLARELNTSNIPIREAMGRLEQAGWVERIPNRGVFVTELTENDIMELCQARELIEARSVELVTESITPTQLTVLEEAFEAADAAYKNHELVLGREADTHFHRQIVHFAGNSRLETFHATTLLKAQGYFFMFLGGLPAQERSKLGYADVVEHRDIFNAIKDGDVKRAREEVVKHIRMAGEAALTFHRIAAALR